MESITQRQVELKYTGIDQLKAQDSITKATVPQRCPTTVSEIPMAPPIIPPPSLPPYSHLISGDEFGSLLALLQVYRRKSWSHVLSGANGYLRYPW